MNTCTVQELKEKRDRGDEFVLLDVREAEELTIAAIAGASHVPLGDLPMRAPELSAWKDREVICMCHHGMRSARAQQILQNAGFTNVRNLTGGIHAWSVLIDPAVAQY
ncbi:MAG: rhodanese-like domain-containing protein [Candidatus Hydrogenedentes bacterium]|nr:rhodanese-like domain-containing protein [Candidatus Hydrogenedentota bacterium]